MSNTRYYTSSNYLLGFLYIASQTPPRPTHTPVNMRAALFLATALVVANARSKWRADRAMLPAPATLPGYPANHTQTHNPEQCTHTLAAQMAVYLNEVDAGG